MVKPGYKQTEVGVIPEDWDIDTFKNVGSFFKGSGISMKDVKPTGFPCIMYGDIYVKFDTHFEKCDFKIDEVTARKSTRAISNDLFFTASGETAEEIGKCVSYQGQADIYIGGDIIAIRPKDEYDSLFLAFVQSSSLLVRQKAMLAQGHTVVHINKDNIASLLFACPELHEQKRIAEALSDVDSMISSLEKLVTKKKAIKQGAMQELLTGKKRLPGFTGEWELINLSQKSKIKARIGWQGLTTNEYLDSGYSYLVTGTDFMNGKIDWDNCHYVAKDRFDQDKNIQIQNNDILITKDGSLGKTALVKGLNKPATLNSGVFVIRPIQKSYDPAFVYYILSSFVFKDFLDHLSAGSTIIHLYQKDINKFEFLMPPTIEEQTAIASILSDMDNEIEALEQKLAKTRQLKQGMMQQLLTGKIRLV